MPVVERLSSFIARVRPAWFRGRGVGVIHESPPESTVDPAEEFLKIQRGLRRLSLASDRSGEILQAVATRLDDVQQALLNLERPRESALILDESQLLGILDQLDHAGPSLAPVTNTLMAEARWQRLAVIGESPDVAGIRIAEYLGESSDGAAAGIQIQQILQQGYRRADGSLLRPGVVIAGPAPAAEAHASIS